MARRRHASAVLLAPIHCLLPPPPATPSRCRRLQLHASPPCSHTSAGVKGSHTSNAIAAAVRRPPCLTADAFPPCIVATPQRIDRRRCFDRNGDGRPTPTASSSPVSRHHDGNDGKGHDVWPPPLPPPHSTVVALPTSSGVVACNEGLVL